MSKPSNIVVSDNCTAFEVATVGTKVLSNKLGFLAVLGSVVDAAEKEERFKENGQAFIHLPKQLYPSIRCGVAKMQTVLKYRYPDSDPKEGYNFGLKENTHVFNWRGVPTVFAHPRCAADLEMAAAVMYTREAYNRDPDVVGSSRETAEFTHVLVALIGTAGPKAPLSPNTLVHNIGGGNNRYIPVASVDKDLALLHRIIAEAKECEAYAKQWMVVADPL